MCFFVLAVVPASVNVFELGDLAARHGRTISPIDSALLPLTIAKREWVATTCDGCDCGSALFTPGREIDPIKLEKDVQSLRTQGWSEANVQTWRNAQGPMLAEREKREREILGWADFLDAALTLPGVPYVGLLGHWLDEEIHGEGRAPFERREHTTSVLRGRFGAPFARDVIHVFRKEAAVR